MGKYNKLIGTLVGLGIGYGISKGVLPAVMNDPELIGDITMAISAAIGTWIAPKNTN